MKRQKRASTKYPTKTAHLATRKALTLTEGMLWELNCEAKRSGQPATSIIVEAIHRHLFSKTWQGETVDLVSAIQHDVSNAELRRMPKEKFLELCSAMYDAKVVHKKDFRRHPFPSLLRKTTSP